MPDNLSSATAPQLEKQLQVGTPFTLPNGVTIRNRLVKASMAEGHSSKDMLPHAEYNTNYGRWAQGGWGMVFTGNWMIDSKGCGGPGGVLINNPNMTREMEVDKIITFAHAARANGTKVLVQLCHAGKQGVIGGGDRGLFEPNMAPSAVPQYIGPGLLARGLASIFFGTPREMTRADIDAVVDKFTSAARVVADAGLDGVELHGAHGYLISQFLSADANRRTDEYGGSALGRTLFATRVIRAIRAAVPPGFIVGIKLNSADYQLDRRHDTPGSSAPAAVDNETQLRECIEQFAAIAAAGVDFVEVSGGSMADPQMAVGPPKSTRTAAREAFFLNFAETFRASCPDVPLVVTGGFRSRAGMEEALASGGTDFVGCGRAAIISPGLPAEIMLNPDVPDEQARVDVPRFPPPWWLRWGPQMVGLGYENAIYCSILQKLGTDNEGR